MSVFDLDRALVGDYERFARSFTQIRAADIRSRVEEIYASSRFWPEPLISINPHFEGGASVAELATEGLLHADTARIFRVDGQPIRFHRHQEQAIAKAARGQSFAVTTGTGSGKSLCFFVPIIDAAIRARVAGEPLGDLLAQEEAPITQLGELRVQLAMADLQCLALLEQAIELLPRLGQRQMPLLQLRPFGGTLLLLRRAGDDLAILLLLTGMLGRQPARHVVETRRETLAAALDLRHGVAKHPDVLFDRRIQLCEQGSVRPLAKSVAEGGGAILGDRIDKLLEACGSGADRVTQIGDCFCLPCPQRLVRMSRIDQLRVRPLDDLHFLQALADDLDLGDDVLNFANTIVEIPQIQGALLNGTLRLLNIGAGCADGLLGELVDQGELEPRIGRDLLDFILTVDVGLEYEIAIEGNRNRFTVAIQDLDVVPPRSFRAIVGPVPGLDFKMDRPATEIAAHMTFDSLGARPAVGGFGHHAEDVADELEDRGLAGAAAADDTIEAVTEFQSRTVEKATGYRQAQDSVVRPADVLIMFGCGDIAPWQFGHLLFLLGLARRSVPMLMLVASNGRFFVLFLFSCAIESICVVR